MTSITPTEQSIRLYEKAGQPAELMLVNGTSHFPLSEKDAPRTRVLIRSWLDQLLPDPAARSRMTGEARRTSCFVATDLQRYAAALLAGGGFRPQAG